MIWRSEVPLTTIPSPSVNAMPQKPVVTPAGADPRASSAPQILLFFIASLLLFLLVRNGTEFITSHAQELTPLWLVIVPGVAGAAFWWVRYDMMAPFMRRFSTASAIFLTFYFATEPFLAPLVALESGHPAVTLLQHGRWLGLALAVLSFFRPAALFACAMLLWFMRDLLIPATGFYFSNLDIRNVVEVMAFCGAAFTLLAASMQVPRLRSLLGMNDHVVRQAALIVLAFAIGGHLGNYFFSAIAKLTLDGGVFSWIFDNRLYDGIPGALEKGTFPFAASPWLTQFVYDAVKLFNFPLHVFSFAAQFAAIIAVARRRWVMAITVIYDLFHLVVYLTFGLLFWKWIALNAVILATLAVIPDSLWTRSVRIAAGAGVLCGVVFFKTATLAWYESPGFMSVYFEAETVDGERYRVPNAYFHTGSYQVSQGRLYAPGDEGHFNFSIWGSVLHYADAKAGRACEAPSRDGPVEPLYGPPEALSRYVALHHETVLRKGGSDGFYNYNRYIHHHMPSPFYTTPFYKLDKRDIKAYYYVAESVCLGLEKGQLKRDVLKRTEIPLWETSL